MGNKADDEFHRAVTWKDWQALRTLINRSKQQPYDCEYVVDLLIKNEWILTKVVTLGRLDLTKLFFESVDTISVHDVDANGWSGLHRAAYDGYIDQVKFFLENNADPNRMCDCHQTPLYWSFYETYGESIDYDENLKIMKMLIDAGAKVTTTADDVSYLQVQSALVEGNLETVEFVLNLCTDLRAHYYNGDTVLHYLAKNEHPEIFMKIHGKNFDVNARNNEQKTPLYFAAQEGIVETIEFLLNEGADVNAVDKRNWTPTRIATQYYEDYGDRNMKCIELLLQHGADIQVVATTVDPPTTIFDTILKFKDERTLILYELMLEHLALQEVNGPKIIEIIQNKIDPTRIYFDNCKKLLLTKIHEAKTLLELLSCSEEKLVVYIRNTELVRIINDFCDELKLITIFYGNLLQKRFDKASRTAALRGSAAIVICKLVHLDYDSYYFIVDIILSYLNDQDLIVLLSLSL